MFITPSLVTVALFLSCSASPAPDGGTVIDFRKHNSFVKADGMLDHEAAIEQVYRDKNKHRNNLINVKSNIGLKQFNKGAEILPFAEYIPTLSRRQSEPLTDVGESYWYGPISVGKPAKKFNIDFDTGSADLWFPSVNCTSTYCSTKSKYNPKNSTSSSAKPGSFTIGYADGSKVSGPIYTDTVNIAGVNVVNQYFSPVNTISASFGSQSIDGILGLAYPSISSLGQNNFFVNAKSQRTVKNGVFGFKIAKTGSSLYLGGTDSSKYSGGFEYHAVTGGKTYWQIGNAKLVIGSKTIVSGVTTIIDSGTSIMYGPPSQVATFYKSIPGSAVYDSSSGFYSFPCASVPTNIAFNWGGKNWVITSANFILGKINTTQCVGAISGLDLGLGTNVWLLGDSFMKNVYTAFSFDQNAVGFATVR